MQFTTIVSLLFAAAAVSAAPGSSLSERQQRTIYVRLFNDQTCGPTPWVEDVVFNQNVGGCTNTGIAIPHQSAQFSDSSITCTLRLYDRPNCDEAGRHVDVASNVVPGTCTRINVQSGKFIC